MTLQTRLPEPRPPDGHEIYLLRVWYEFDGDQPIWRASLRVPDHEQRRHFASPDRLLAFLGERLLGHEEGGGPAP